MVGKRPFFCCLYLDESGPFNFPGLPKGQLGQKRPFRSVRELAQRGHHFKGPLLLGTARDEGAMFLQELGQVNLPG